MCYEYQVENFSRDDVMIMLENLLTFQFFEQSMKAHVSKMFARF